MLTAKHFEVIAAELKAGDSSERGEPEQYGYRQAVKVVAGALRQINPRFDEQRFVAACTPEES